MLTVKLLYFTVALLNQCKKGVLLFGAWLHYGIIKHILVYYTPQDHNRKSLFIYLCYLYRAHNHIKGVVKKINKINYS